MMNENEKESPIKVTLIGYCKHCKRSVKLYVKQDKTVECGRCWLQKRLAVFGFDRVKVVFRKSEKNGKVC